MSRSVFNCEIGGKEFIHALPFWVAAKPALGDPRFNTAIQSPSPAFEQSNPTATESMHDKECDSSVALVASSVGCERPPSADGGGRVSMSTRELPPFRCMGLFAFAIHCDL